MSWEFRGGASMLKDPTTNAGDLRDAGSILGSGRSPGGGHGNPLQCSCLGNPRDRGTWSAKVHRVAEELATTKPPLICVLLL